MTIWIIIGVLALISVAGYRARVRRIARETTTDDLPGVFYFDGIVDTTATTKRNSR